jgi:hypothetical protein
MKPAMASQPNDPVWAPTFDTEQLGGVGIHGHAAGAAGWQVVEHTRLSH